MESVFRRQGGWPPAQKMVCHSHMQLCNIWRKRGAPVGSPTHGAGTRPGKCNFMPGSCRTAPAAGSPVWAHRPALRFGRCCGSWFFIILCVRLFIVLGLNFFIIWIWFYHFDPAGLFNALLGLGFDLDFGADLFNLVGQSQRRQCQAGDACC